jgi:hypothetical protein
VAPTATPKPIARQPGAATCARRMAPASALMDAAMSRRGAIRSTSQPIARVPAMAAKVWGMKLAAACAGVRPRSPSREIWWKARPVVISPVPATAAVTTQKIGVRTACARVQLAAVGTSPMSGAGSPSRRWPTSAGELRMPQRAKGSTTSHTATAAATQAPRQPRSAMQAASASGARDMSA